MNLKPISRQVVVIVGANSGIGRATALEFAAQGAKVVAAGRSMEEMQKLTAEITRQGGEATPVAADTTRYEDLARVANEAVDTYGGLDTWVHLAAVSVYAPFDQTSPDEFKRVVEVNLVGQAYGAMAALPHLKRLGGGSLIHVSSTEAIQSIPYHSAYAAAKHGIPGFLDSLRMELDHEGYNINVVNIMPGSINTPFFAKARTRLGVKPAPIPPVYEAETVARAILYAAIHRVENLPVGGSAKAFQFFHRYAPTLSDAMVEKPGFRLQRSQEPKTDTAPTNLYEHLDGFDRVEGEFSRQAKPVSFATWFDIHPLVRAAMSLAAFTGALMALRAIPLRSTAKSLPAARRRAMKANRAAQKGFLSTPVKQVAKATDRLARRRSRTIPERVAARMR